MRKSHSTSLPKVLGIMAQELHWSAEQQRQEIVDTEKFMESMGVPLGSPEPDRPVGIERQMGVG